LQGPTDRALFCAFLSALTAGIAAAATWIAPPPEAIAASSHTGAIFMYHHVSPHVLPGPSARALTITPAEFRDQLTWLHARGCRIVSVDALYGDARAHTLARCETALTFDDGYDDAVTFALPLLKEFGAPATFYVATGFVGTPGHVSVAQLRLMRESGMEIGAHTVHHVDLTTLTQAQTAHELNASAASLRRWLNADVTSFAYPAGQFNARAVSAVRDAAFENAVTTQPGDVQATSRSYELPRYRIGRGSGLRLMQSVFGRQDASSAPVSGALANIARKRIAGNAPALAEGVAVALLARRFPEQILKVHVLSLRPATVAGIVLSGVKLHRAVNRQQFEADIADMVRLTFDSSPLIDEVDIWATVPLEVGAGMPVSGDYAVPTSRTVFSAAVTRAQTEPSGKVNLGKMYMDPQFLRP
jgi:peptidoglycan/xylan/chitin deacetylase (PgdA/CDA1 family)